MPRLIDLTGRSFYRWTVLRRDMRIVSPKPPQWICECQCGRISSVQGHNLVGGLSKSCGCLISDMKPNLIHGHTVGGIFSKEYRAWANIKTRCTNPRSNSYKYYGGRGIRMCRRWFKSFEAFYSDLGPAPSPLHTIERINNDGNYEPSNCKWATRSEQVQNQRRSFPPITINGKTMPLIAWCRERGLCYQTIRDRVRVSGMTPLAAITTPPMRTKRREHP
jgi:hypothetical protein